MFTLKKLWNALNYAGKPWQISLAIALAFVVGLTPISSIHNILILFLALILNIHFGIFLLFSAIFSGIGYMFDPIATNIGLSLLTNSSLESLWTSLYNNPILRLTNFNNSTVIGSLVVSLLLFLPIFLFINIFLKGYRSKVASGVGKIPLLNKLSYFKDEDPKAGGVIRVSGIVFFAIIGGGIYFISNQYLDNFLKTTIEKQIENNSNKIVNIDTLNLQLLNSKLILNDIKIKDKKDNSKNMNIKTIDVDINILQLILKKVIIENIIINKISFPNNIKVASSTSAKTENNKDLISLPSSNFDIKSLQNIDTSNINELLNGNAKNKFNEYKKYYEQIKPYFNMKKTKKDEKIVHTRDGGVWVNFNDNTTIPDVLVKNGKFSIIYQNETYKGTIKDFTTQQYKYNKPFIVTLNSTTKKVKDLNVIVSIFKNDTMKISASNLKIDNISKNKFDLKDTTAKFDGTIEILHNSSIKGKINLNVLNATITIKQDNKYIDILNNSLKNITNIKGYVDIAGKINNPSIKVNINLDKIIKSKLNLVIKDQLKALKKKAKEKIKAKVKEKVKKELQNKIGKEISDKLGDKIIKGLFNF